MKKSLTVLIVVAIVLGILLLLGPFFIVEEGEQALIIRFGEIVKEETTAGLKFKMPIVDNVIKYSKKILPWDGEPQRVPTKENQFIWVDVTARWRITDPRKFYSSVTTMERAYSRLDDIIDSIVRTTIAENLLREAVRSSNLINELERTEYLATTESTQEDVESLQEMAEFTHTRVQQENIQKGRRALSEEMLAAAKTIVPDFGIDVIDIIIRQIRYSDDLTESVYNRMIKERNQIAQAYRSFGEGKKKEWMGKLENEQRSILSKAYEESEKIKGEADALAARIYSETYGKDPDFFEFWRSIESYRTVVPNFRKTLTTDMNYFKYLYSPSGGR
ncbi:MAG TPA: protease modulator HflC [Spirochaetales bacterium]|nr:protease modulator HflC [Spirochaetales bacterium]